MQTEILLKQIQQHILQLRHHLDEFEAAGQPDSVVSDKLNSGLHDLGKLVGAYSFIKQQQELSPRLDLHMKVSEKLQPGIETPAPEKQETQQAEPVKTPAPAKKTEMPVSHAEPVKHDTPPTNNYPKINIGINDKFRFINELFKSNAVEYGIAVEQINAIGSWHDTQVYLNGLKNIYGWDEEEDMVKKIFSLAQKRF